MTNNPHDDIAHIRSMMERSSRFISLSGISGIMAGIFALLAAASAIWVFKHNGIDYFGGNRIVYSENVLSQLVMISLVTLVLAIGSAFFFTRQKSKRQQVKMWSRLTINLLTSFSVPLLAGGVFCLALLYHSLFPLVAPVMLIFYGLALVNASKYTFSDIGYLGYCEIALGLIAIFFTGYGLLFWAIGFGVLHIIYGWAMYRKYERE